MSFQEVAEAWLLGLRLTSHRVLFAISVSVEALTAIQRLGVLRDPPASSVLNPRTAIRTLTSHEVLPPGKAPKPSGGTGMGPRWIDGF